MTEHSWVAGFPGAVTVCDGDGIILEMNAMSAQAFSGDGGIALIGSNVMDCHPEPARTKLQTMRRERRANVYTIEKGGTHKLVLQAPWYHDGSGEEYGGFVEIVVQVPAEMPHFVRDKA
jgi:hypothetical protein